jgi:hypothetical protein
MCWHITSTNYIFPPNTNSPCQISLDVLNSDLISFLLIKKCVFKCKCSHHGYLNPIPSFEDLGFENLLKMKKKLKWFAKHEDQCHHYIKEPTFFSKGLENVLFTNHREVVHLSNMGQNTTIFKWMWKHFTLVNWFLFAFS